jgi:GNAT superfamily N-acetyltransferase
MDIQVVPAIESDLTYIDHLQRKNAEDLAFYPKQVFEREILNHRILLARVNNDPAGYIYHGSLGQQVKIHQACIEYDLRGQLYGAALIRHLIDLVSASNGLSISLRCGSDIAANGFWKAMGFYCQGVTAGGIRRMRDINNWRYDLQPQLFVTQTDPSDKKKSAALWRKYKDENPINSFKRGKALTDHRKMIEDKDADEKVARLSLPKARQD